MRCVGLGILWRLACLHFTLTCKQKEPLPELSSSDWLQMALSLVYIAPACCWCAFGLLDLEGGCFFLVTKDGKVPKLVASFTLKLFGRALKAFYMNWITTIWTSVLALVGLFDIKLLLVLALHLYTFIPILLVVWLSMFARWLLFLVLSCW